MAPSIKHVFDDCPFNDGYDLKIGTSERGSETVESKSYSMPVYKHALIVFGGVAGIEECVDADESLTLPGSKSHTLFDQWVNICPLQGSRTIRTEEAVLIALAKLCPLLSVSAATGDDALKTTSVPNRAGAGAGAGDFKAMIDVMDDDVSEESSESESE
jgi:hypothetical protein